MARALNTIQQTVNQGRTIFLVFEYANLQQNTNRYHCDVLLKKLKDQEEKEAFLLTWPIEPPNVDALGHNSITKTTSALLQWCQNGSFYICNKCNSVNPVNMPQNFMKQPNPSRKSKCKCLNERYHVPRANEIPEPLLNLSKENIKCLRPFDLDCGVYNRHSHGYRTKTGMINLIPSRLTVINKIRQLTNPTDRRKCRRAYEHLIRSPNTHYSHFVSLREQIQEENSDINTFDFSVTAGIECALWPNIYPFSSWCESLICGQDSRLSMKAAFCTKLFSEIQDYLLHFDLLQWHYDRTLYKIVSGAINTARIMNCSPAKALDTKSFSPTYWQWQHRYLLDAVHQFGVPDVFITISPFEWSFPFANWLSSLRHIAGKGPTEIAGYETFNIAHVLEQIVRGYLCGSNSQKWTNHLFSYNRSSTQKNIKTYFYRFEFQKRGTLHLHMLVWLHNMTKIQRQFFRADIPHDKADLAFYAHKLQPSDKPSNCLNLQTAESYISMENGKYVHHLKHPAEEFALNLRAYISTLLPVLKCRMDYQTTDGAAMLLHYVTSYVTKFQESVSLDSLYSYELEGRQAATRYLMCETPAEPEMWFFLYTKKIAWSNSRTKRFVVPISTKASNDKTVIKYLHRPQNLNSLSMIEWLRKYDTNASTPKQYKQGTTLVGTQMLSVSIKNTFSSTVC